MKVIDYKMLYKNQDQKEYKVTRKVWDNLKIAKSDAIFLKTLSKEILGDNLLECYFNNNKIQITLRKYNEEISVIRG